MNEVIKNKIYNEEQCIDIQEKLSEKIIINSKIQIESISKIAGIDLAYWKKMIMNMQCVVLL